MEIEKNVEISEKNDLIQCENFIFWYSKIEILNFISKCFFQKFSLFDWAGPKPILFTSIYNAFFIKSRPFCACLYLLVVIDW